VGLNKNFCHREALYAMSARGKVVRWQYSFIFPDCLGILPKICGCCLGEMSTDANEIVECDGCGIAVHEGCYGVGAGASLVETGSVTSTVSSASTEPWFCEPCRAGLFSPPRFVFCSTFNMNV